MSGESWNLGILYWNNKITFFDKLGENLSLFAQENILQK